jgi:hypothetical protein
MKKVVIPLFSCFLVLTLLLTSFSIAKADSNDDPVVTPVSGDMEFQTEIVPLTNLPGTTELNQMLVPVGFPTNEAQFGGNGVLVKSMDSGKATLCYFIRSIELKQGWGGKIGIWNGTKWNLFATSITIPDEGSYSTACTNIYGSGTYAFIKYIVDRSLLPTKPECSFTITPAFWPNAPVFNAFLSIAPQNLVFSAIIPSNYPPVGTPVFYRVLNFSPAGSVFGTMSGTVQHGIYGAPFADFIDLHVNLLDFESASLYVEYPSCWAILNYTPSSVFD